MKWTLPNILTTLRMLAAPGVAVMFLYFHRPWADWLALALFVGAAITDYFDGYLARLWKQESKFGAMLDPIADKAMVVIALVVITGFSGMNPWILLPATLIIFSGQGLISSNVGAAQWWAVLPPFPKGWRVGSLCSASSSCGFRRR
jgi:cardiolipin synthase